MGTSLYRFSEVEAKTAKPLAVTSIIKDVLRADDDACYAEMERFLLPGGVSGAKAFDQAYAVGVLLKHDSLHGGRIATVMESTGMSRRLLWDRLHNVLRQVGFQLKHGRLVGVLEDQRPAKNEKSDDDFGQPDIE